MNMRLISKLSKEVSAGNGAWALLTINEYPELNPHLKAALVKKAELSLNGVSFELIAAIKEGKTLSNLPAELAFEAKEIVNSGTNRKLSKVPDLSLRMEKRWRLRSNKFLAGENFQKAAYS